MLLRPACGLLALLLIVGCGSSSATPTITLTGVATYDRVPATSGGLDYAATQSKPIRGAIVQIRDPSGTRVWSRATTSETGAFAIAAPASRAVMLVVIAALGDPANPDTRVVDAGGAPYALSRAFTTDATSGPTTPLHAASGWSGGSYLSARAAAPFAILDTIHEARTLIRTAQPGVAFPPLVVDWSPTNQGGTYFSPADQRLVISGKADVDTDEFDAHVIAHEWGHYWEDNFSRSDNIGGTHSGNNILDERVAFGEGFANAFSGFVNRSPLYIDTAGAGQAAVTVALDFEADTQVGTETNGRTREGAWSEASVQELLWDLYDGGPGAVAGSDGDAVALGFAPIHAAMRGPQRTFPGFATIYSLLDAVKAANPASAAAIAALAAQENIQDHDAFQELATNRQRYIAVPTDGTPVSTGLTGGALATDATFGAIGASFPGNKLFNWQWFSVAIPGSGSWDFDAIPVASSGDLIISRGGPSPADRDVVYGGSERLTTSTAGPATLVFAVGSFGAAEAFTVRCGRSGTLGKPTAEVPPVPLPAGHG